MRAALLLLVAAPALADAPDSWAAFRAEVEAACRALVEGQGGEGMGEVAVEVSPFGSESYGAALVTVTAAGTAAAGTDRMVCVMDKATRRAELAAPFAPSEPALPEPALPEPALPEAAPPP